MRAIVHKLWNTPPAILCLQGRRKIRRLLVGSDSGYDYSLGAVLRKPKHMDFKMEIERMERLWRMCKLEGLEDMQTHFDLSTKSVLEIGCGPVFGYGPVALFRGAEKFWYREPNLERAVVEAAAIKAAYFRPQYQELVANYGRLLDFEEWYSKVIELSRPLEPGALNAADITISYCVLQNIPRRIFKQFVLDTSKASRPGGLFAHTVDFGHCGVIKGSLASLYKTNWENEPENINLLRKCDIEEAMRAAGMEVAAALIYKSEEVDASAVHPSWSRYTEESLSARVVHFLGRRRGNAE